MVNNKKQSIREIVDYYLKENPGDLGIENTEDDTYNIPDNNEKLYKGVTTYKDVKITGNYKDFTVYTWDRKIMLVDYFVNLSKKEVAAYVGYILYNQDNKKILKEKKTYKNDKYETLYMSDIYFNYFFDIVGIDIIISDDWFSDSGRKLWKNYMIPIALDKKYECALISQDPQFYKPITKENWNIIKNSLEVKSKIFDFIIKK